MPALQSPLRTVVSLGVLVANVAFVTSLEVHAEAESEGDPISRLSILEKALRENGQLVELLRQPGSTGAGAVEPHAAAEVNPLRQVTEMQERLLKGELTKEKELQAEKTKRDITAFIKNVQDIAQKVDPRLVSMLSNNKQPLESDATKREFAKIAQGMNPWDKKTKKSPQISMLFNNKKPLEADETKHKFRQLAKDLNPLHKTVKKHSKHKKAADDALLKAAPNNANILRLNKAFDTSDKSDGVAAEAHFKEAAKILADAHAVHASMQATQPIAGANIFKPLSESKANQPVPDEIQKFQDHLDNRGSQVTWTLSIVYGSLVFLAFVVFVAFRPAAHPSALKT